MGSPAPDLDKYTNDIPVAPLDQDASKSDTNPQPTEPKKEEEVK